MYFTLFLWICFFSGVFLFGRTAKFTDTFCDARPPSQKEGREVDKEHKQQMTYWAGGALTMRVSAHRWGWICISVRTHTQAPMCEPGVKNHQKKKKTCLRLLVHVRRDPTSLFSSYKADYLGIFALLNKYFYWSDKRLERVGFSLGFFLMLGLKKHNKPNLNLCPVEMC